MATETSSMRYRSTHEITAEILSLLAVGPLTKTKVMYRAYLSYYQLKNYMALLADNNLAELKDSKLYITDAGTLWLKKYKAVSPIQRKGATPE